VRRVAEKRPDDVGVAFDAWNRGVLGSPRGRAVRRAGQRDGISCRAGLYRRRQDVRVQRFFALPRAADVPAADFFRAPPRDVVAPPFAFTLRFAAVFRPALPFAFDPSMRPVAMSSCRCSEPITRPSDSAERSSSDSSSRDRSRARVEGIVFLAIQSPFSRAVCPDPEIEQGVRQLFRCLVARARDSRKLLNALKKHQREREPKRSGAA